MVGIKNNEKPERAKGRERQRKATKSNKKQKRTLELEKPKRVIKTKKHEKVQMETRRMFQFCPCCARHMFVERLTDTLQVQPLFGNTFKLFI